MTNNDDLMAWMTEQADATADLEYPDNEINAKSGYIYPSNETAWLGYYIIDPTAGGYRAVCLQHKTGLGCGAVFDGLTRKKTMTMVEVHIMRDGLKRATHKRINYNGPIPF